MTPQSELEIKGNFFSHPFTELLAEVSQAGLNGSLRVTEKDTKCVVYFKRGQVVFAVSNARSTRLFDLLLRRNKLKKEDLVQIPNFSNDFELTKFLTEKGILTKDETDRLFKDQMESILVDVMTWKSGDWEFSPLARIRDGISFDLELRNHLVNYSRCLSNEAVLNRFRTLDETFRRSEASELSLDLTLEEGFVLSRSDDGDLSASNLISLAAMDETTVLRSLYTLWIMGLLVRENWNPAFSRAHITAIKGAKLELRTEARDRVVAPSDSRRTTEDIVTEPQTTVESTPRPEEEVLPLEKYLDRVENAETYYDILGVDLKADADELKRSYFFLAKNFHPDRYHSDGGAVLKRIQNAFTELAQAHETLKNPESREVYDYRMRKEIAELEKRQASGASGTQNVQIEQATENFDRGFSLLMENEPEAALPFLARAAHYAPKNARYRAYYGRALAFDDKQRHKAEAEMQAALKIDPNNPTFRIMLAEFFIQFSLIKRAEGELTRLLTIFPSNREARQLLDSLKVSG